jgi:hypothetical protein
VPHSKLANFASLEWGFLVPRQFSVSRGVGFPYNFTQKTTSTEKHGQFFPMLSVPFSRETNRTYFTMILPLGSSVPCTRTRLPSNLATSV